MENGGRRPSPRFRAASSGPPAEQDTPLGPPEPPADTDSFWGLSWRVPDLDAARERLVECGFDVSEIRAGRKPGTRVCTVRAPTHGVATLLIQPATR